MRYWLIPLLLIASGCGKEPAFVDKDLIEFVRAFEIDTGVYAGNIVVMFKETTAPTIGLCYSWSDGEREINVDPEAWSTLNQLGKEQLIYHELGHCAMDLDHDNRRVYYSFRQSIQGSMMNAYFFGLSWNYEHYNAEYKRALAERRLIVP